MIISSDGKSTATDTHDTQPIRNHMNHMNDSDSDRNVVCSKFPKYDAAKYIIKVDRRSQMSYTFAFTFTLTQSRSGDATRQTTNRFRHSTCSPHYSAALIETHFIQSKLPTYSRSCAIPPGNSCLAGNGRARRHELRTKGDNHSKTSNQILNDIFMIGTHTRPRINSRSIARFAYKLDERG